MNPSIDPSTLKITDMRFADIDGAPKRCTLLKIYTNQGIVGYGEVRDASSKTYALMLLSAKGSDHEVAFVKRGRTFRVNPAKLGSPYAMKEYRYLRDKLNALSDQSLREVCGELLDLYALICYPERFVNVGEEDLFLNVLLALGRRYLGQKEGELDPGSAKLLETLAKTIAENPPLLG